jgi:hypothetical protein
MPDGHAVKLGCLTMPFPEKNFRTTIYDAIDRFTGDGHFQIIAEAALPDRYGFISGDIISKRSNELQSLRQQLVEKGLAKLLPWSCPKKKRHSLLAAEKAAQKSKVGLWADNQFGLQSVSPSLLKNRISEFHTIQGTILSVGQTRRLLYLNFGPYWKEDFTVTVAQSDLATLFGEGFDSNQLEGAVVQVRGWVEWDDGPMIQIHYPDQLEILSQ